MYEGRTLPPLSRWHFVRRLLAHMLVAHGLIVVSLVIGMSGYTYFESLQWRDSFLNTAMLLGGMGPVDAPKTNGGKVFAAFYALYAGLVFIFITGLLLAPLVHRVLHRFHWSDEDQRLS